MTNPLEALESLVASKREHADRVYVGDGNQRDHNRIVHEFCDELDLIIQDFKNVGGGSLNRAMLATSEARHAENVALAEVKRLTADLVAARFSEREWRDKAQDKIAEVESLRAERDSLVEYLGERRSFVA